MIKSHRNIDVLPMDCGVRKFPETETQWLVVITDQYESFQCTGALITYHHMLFPASCLSKADNVKNILHPSNFLYFHHLHQQFIQCFLSSFLSHILFQYKIYLSQDDCWQKNNCQSGKSFNVKESLVLFHPQYDAITNQNDIALVQLNKPINKIRGIKTMKLNSANVITYVFIVVQPVCLPVANKQWFERSLKTVGVNGYFEDNDDDTKTVHYERQVLKTMKENLCKKELGAHVSV